MSQNKMVFVLKKKEACYIHTTEAESKMYIHQRDVKNVTWFVFIL